MGAPGPEVLLGEGWVRALGETEQGRPRPDGVRNGEKRAFVCGRLAVLFPESISLRADCFLCICSPPKKMYAFILMNARCAQ